MTHKTSKKVLFFILVLISAGLFTVKIPSAEVGTSTYNETLEGTITKVKNWNEPQGDTIEILQELTVQVDTGSLKGETVLLENSDTQSLNTNLYEEKDRIVFEKSNEPRSEAYTLTLTDHIRRPSLYWLFGLFFFIVLLVSQKQGLESLIGMAFSFLVLFKWVLPLLLAGYNPILTAISGALLIIPISFYLSHGITKKTTVAIGGTILTLLLTGFLAEFFVYWAKLSGLTDDSALYLKADTGDALHFQGLLLAGLIISMLGLLDDITISQASVAQQLKEAKPKIRFVELYSRTMEVGKDHIASMVNTLILIYAGASLPLLMLFLTNAHPFTEIINYEFVAEESIRTLVGSIGLILAVPITTFLASLGHNHPKNR